MTDRVLLLSINNRDQNKFINTFDCEKHPSPEMDQFCEVDKPRNANHSSLQYRIQPVLAKIINRIYSERG